MPDDVKPFPGRHPYRDLGSLHDEIVALVLQYDGRCSLAEALGVLRLVEDTLIKKNTAT